jgi:outer membrane murein-binding lipoprotein Lpp
VRILPLLPLLAAACGGEPDVATPKAAPDLATHEGVTDAHIGAMEDLADVLDGIRDRQGVEDARGRIEEIGSRIREINAAEDKLPPASPIGRAQLDAKMDEAAQALEPRFQQALDRLKADPKAVVLLSDMVAEAVFDPDR